MLPVLDNSNAAAAKAGPTLCYVTDRRSLVPGGDDADTGLLAKIRIAIEAGVDWVQIREKDLATGRVLALAREAVSASESHGHGSQSQLVRTKVIVNDRLDVALAANAAGIHLGRESAPVREVANWCRAGNAPGEFLIGASCHSLIEARDAESAGASYVFFGPVFDTPSKRELGLPVGIAQLAEVCATVRIPVLAIGGVDPRNAQECFSAGAAGIAAIRMFQEANDADELKSTVASLRVSFGNSTTH